MWIRTKSLFTYQSPLHTTLKFWYVPLPKREQAKLRKNYDGYVSAYLFLRDILRDQLVLFEETTDWGTFTYEWPHDEEVQDHLLNHRCPKELIIELGAYVLGIQRLPEEDHHGFVSRALGGEA